MTILDILTYPAPSLNQPSEPVTQITPDILQLIEDMGQTMIESQGVGLAAPQVGVNKQIIVYDHRARYSEEDQENEPDPSQESETFKALINPQILEGTGRFMSEQEGCLSVPEFRSDVERFKMVHVKALEPSGNPVEFQTSGLQSVIMQHEIDHLVGTLFIERISALKRAMYKKRVKKQLKKMLKQQK